MDPKIDPKLIDNRQTNSYSCKSGFDFVFNRFKMICLADELILERLQSLQKLNVFDVFMVRVFLICVALVALDSILVSKLIKG